MVADERDRLIAAEQDIDPLDRAVVEFVVKYGAKELGVHRRACGSSSRQAYSTGEPPEQDLGDVGEPMPRAVGRHAPTAVPRS